MKCGLCGCVSYIGMIRCDGGENFMHFFVMYLRKISFLIVFLTYIVTCNLLGQLVYSLAVGPLRVLFYLINNSLEKKRHIAALMRGNAV